MALVAIVVLMGGISGYAESIEINAKPTDPLWPNTFQQNFTETFYYPVIGTHYTRGTYYYDFTNKRYRIDRVNGRYDRYCGFNGVRAFQNTPCTQLVVNGMRWVIYPEKQDCCQYVYFYFILFSQMIRQIYIKFKKL